MRYLKARLLEKKEQLMYRAYVTDSLQLAPQNKALMQRWIDAIKEPTPDNRTGDEVALDVIQRLGLTVKGSEPPEA